MYIDMYLWDQSVYALSTVKCGYDWLFGEGKDVVKERKISPESLKQKSGYLYAFKISKDSYKVGKSVNVERRIRAYKTIHPSGYVHHQVACSDMHHSERILHDLLKMHGYPF